MLSTANSVLRPTPYRIPRYVAELFNNSVCFEEDTKVLMHTRCKQNFDFIYFNLFRPKQQILCARIGAVISWAWPHSYLRYLLVQCPVASLY